jgi:mRNA-degrading endonuclease RelE of RelBE toxin-antitoxin system
MQATIVYSPDALVHLAALPKSDQVTVLDQVDQLLSHQPTLSGRKRRFLRPNAIAQWELRLGELRVFYDVTTDEKIEDELITQQTTVTVKAVGKKTHNELWIGGTKVQL